ncbi:circadian timing LabA-like protein [Candidatus Termititenax aidoneus]|uniref:Circadian timing LabA-like protein n=1 Tax=Termititenax aidoneus TaxID=2218524 RepID=A0A388TBR7_TERA1|nr:circadian timing LabA-like protein [Candidatus Termititenax aidoneus]
MNQNNYAFIDSQNVNLSIKAQNWTLDFQKFRRYLQDKYRVVKAFLFIGYMPENQALYVKLQEFGYILIFKNIVQLADGKVKGNVDAELVLQAMIEFPNYAKAVIVSGDGDFYCLVKYLIDKNKFLKILIPNRTKYSSLYRKFNAKYLSFLNELRQKIGKN